MKLVVPERGFTLQADFNFGSFNHERCRFLGAMVSRDTDVSLGDEVRCSLSK